MPDTDAQTLLTLYPAMGSLKALLPRLQTMQVPAGTALFRELETCQGFPMVLSGEVRVSRSAANGRELELYRVLPGEMCLVSSAGLFAGQPLTAHGVTTCETTLTLLSPPDFQLALTDSWGTERTYPAVLVTCQSWLLTTQIAVEESLFSQKLWMALDRTRYMQSSKTFVMVDRPFWNDLKADGWPQMGMTLTDRLTRGTYLFDNGPDKPGVICLSYAWMSDALKMLPHGTDKRVALALSALQKIYPDVDIASHIIGDPISVSWEADPHFLGAFKGALPGHYRYNHRMYSHFMQDGFAPAERGIFIAGDDVSFTPAWVEGAVQTSLNAVWGIVKHLGGKTFEANPGPGDVFADIAASLAFLREGGFDRVGPGAGCFGAVIAKPSNHG